jgi:hypothetical protein
MRSLASRLAETVSELGHWRNPESKQSGASGMLYIPLYIGIIS